jgi:hypothetical protein
LVYEQTEAYPHDTKHFLAFFKWTKKYNRIEYNLKILPETRFKDPKVAIFTLKMLTGSRL